MAPNVMPSKDKPKFTKQELDLIKEYINRAKPLIYVSFLFLSLFAYLTFAEILDFGKLNGTAAEDLPDFPSKLRYVLIHCTPGLVWLMLCAWFVMLKRLFSPAINPMNGYEYVPEMAKNNLTNTVEHFLLSTVSQLILITQLEASYVINIIPTLSLLFLIGRITFWLGYPRYRGFGFMVSHLPIAATIAFISYKFIRFYIKY